MRMKAALLVIALLAATPGALAASEEVNLDRLEPYGAASPRFALTLMAPFGLPPSAVETIIKLAAERSYLTGMLQPGTPCHALVYGSSPSPAILTSTVVTWSGAEPRETEDYAVVEDFLVRRVRQGNYWLLCPKTAVPPRPTDQPAPTSHWRAFAIIIGFWRHGDVVNQLRTRDGQQSRNLHEVIVEAVGTGQVRPYPGCLKLEFEVEFIEISYEHLRGKPIVVSKPPKVKGAVLHADTIPQSFGTWSFGGGLSRNQPVWICEGIGLLVLRVPVDPRAPDNWLGPASAIRIHPPWRIGSGYPQPPERTLQTCAPATSGIRVGQCGRYVQPGEVGELFQAVYEWGWSSPNKEYDHRWTNLFIHFTMP